MRPGSNAGNGVAAPRDSGRRRFLEVLAILAGTTAAAIITLPAIGFLVAPIFRSSPRRWRSVGLVDQFDLGSTALVSSSLSFSMWVRISLMSCDMRSTSASVRRRFARSAT